MDDREFVAKSDACLSRVAKWLEDLDPDEVDYATADNDTHARLVGLDSGHNVVFEFEYPTTGCNTAWNAIPISLDNLSII